ncbi:MAG TPA: prepilin-type N-terminal cleavage/methylation domain-containing protein [Candidatus Binatia bacterium]|jgi:prepilin-type N-terminal cleavage/methylation domain-containing protein
METNEAGFTLIEILIAITIFSVSVLALGMGTISVIQTNQTSHFNASAINLAQAKLEELRGMTTAVFSGLSCPSYTTAGCSDTQAASGKTFTRSWKFTANSPTTGVSKIDVKIDWTDYTSHSLTFTASFPQ